MHILEVQFKDKRRGVLADRFCAVDLLLGAWRMNGQILGREWPSFGDKRSYGVVVMAPEETSLAEINAGTYVRSAMSKLAELGIETKIKCRCKTPESRNVCSCPRSPWMVLYTNYILLEPPLQCGGCGGVVPLYRFPNPAGEHHNVICWQSDYMACDTLQMNCRTGERFGTMEISRHDSSLSIRGRAICTSLSEISGIPTYYYLYRGSGRTLAAERGRRCPGCGESWLLPQPVKVLDFFDMKCDPCRLVSNIAWDVRSTAELS